MRSGAFGQAGSGVRLLLVGLVAIGLTGCGGVENRRFVGSLATTQGACGLGFGADGSAPATLMLRGANVEFAPTDGVTVLPGHIDGAGHVLAGSNATGADKKPFPQVFEGDRKGDEVSGVFATPRCRAKVTLKRG